MTAKKQTIENIKKTLFCGEKIETSQIETLRSDERKGVQKLLERYEKQQLEKIKRAEAYEQLLHYEKEWKKEGCQFIAGVDEAGRGPLAGPVTAAAAILPDHMTFPGLSDSKKLSREKRDFFEEQLKKHAVAYHVVHIPAIEIDRMNIYEASKKAMQEAIRGLSVGADALFIDAMNLPLSVKQLSLIKGDARSASIAAASVLAKTERDRYMNTLAEKHPKYGFSDHMGYGTKAHLSALREHGPTPEHRRSFAPVRACL